MEKNIPINQNQRPTAKATLPSKALNQDRRPNNEFPRQKKSKRILFHQTSSARDAKGTALRKGRKRERQRNTKRPTTRYIIIKMAKFQDKERILKASREKQEVTYKGAPIILAADFSMEMLQARRE